MPLDVAITKTNSRTHKVKLSGMLDTTTAPQFDRQMEPVLADAEARTLVLEFHDLTYISSAGLGSIANIRRSMSAKKGAMIIVGAQPQIVRVFDMVKLLPKDTVFASHEEADAYFAAMQNQAIEENRQPPQADGKAP